MRAFLLIVTAIASLVVAGPASATPMEGVRGSGIFEFSASGFQLKYTVALDATRTPSGAIAGRIDFFVRGGELIDFGWFEAEPKYLEVTGNTACVVGEITKLTGWYDRPITTVVKVVDVPGGPDGFRVLNIYGPIDPAYACTWIVGAYWSITGGNFTVLP
jgi:hypothetical protein